MGVNHGGQCWSVISEPRAQYIIVDDQIVRVPVEVSAVAIKDRNELQQ